MGVVGNSIERVFLEATQYSMMQVLINWLLCYWVYKYILMQMS